ncbi:MAG: ABC transporter ATP-binding protein [Actinobacteria bacterium]|nr:ABC transporter ATP-binding protein [Actinomycetota bacterium]
MNTENTSMLLDVNGIKTHFETPRGVVRAVDGVSFALARGKSLGIVGESGSGKTILARSIMGLLPRRGTHREGAVMYQGDNLVGKTPQEMRNIWGREMAMIFQDPMTSLNPLMKVGKQIAEPLMSHLGMEKKTAWDTAEKLLRDVRIPEAECRLSQYPHELSGGMRQRVMIVSLVLVTHDLGVVAGNTDEIAVMYAGKLVEMAPTKTLFAEMKMPYTHALLESIPRMDRAAHTRLATIPGRPPDMVHPPQGCRFAPRCAFARDRCHTQEPPLTPGTSPGHTFACFYPVGSAEYSERKVELSRAN